MLFKTSDQPDAFPPRAFKPIKPSEIAKVKKEVAELHATGADICRSAVYRAFGICLGTVAASAIIADTGITVLLCVIAALISTHSMVKYKRIKKMLSLLDAMTEALENEYKRQQQQS